MAGEMLSLQAMVDAGESPAGTCLSPRDDADSRDVQVGRRRRQSNSRNGYWGRRQHHNNRQAQAKPLSAKAI